MRALIFAAATAALLVAPAAYAADATPHSAPSAATPKAEAPGAHVAPKREAPATGAACKAVRITRPDVGHLNRFMITLRRGDLTAVKSCNPDLNVHETPHGIGIDIRYGHDGTVIKLPTTLADDSISNGRCINDAQGDLKDVEVYKAAWTDGLPDHVELQKLNPAFFDKPALEAACNKLMKEHKFH